MGLYFKNTSIRRLVSDESHLEQVVAGAASAIRTMVRIVLLWIIAVIVIGQTVGRFEQAAGQIPFISVGLVHLITVILFVTAAHHRI